MPPLGQETVVGPGPSPPTLISTESGSRIVRAGHKRYFFDLGSNNKGQYLRITEVRFMLCKPLKPPPNGGFVADEHAASAWLLSAWISIIGSTHLCKPWQVSVMCVNC